MIIHRRGLRARGRFEGEPVSRLSRHVAAAGVAGAAWPGGVAGRLDPHSPAGLPSWRPSATTPGPGPDTRRLIHGGSRGQDARSSEVARQGRPRPSPHAAGHPRRSVQGHPGRPAGHRADRRAALRRVQCPHLPAGRRPAPAGSDPGVRAHATGRRGDPGHAGAADWPRCPRPPHDPPARHKDGRGTATISRAKAASSPRRPTRPTRRVPGSRPGRSSPQRAVQMAKWVLGPIDRADVVVDGRTLMR
jgi:hypothetical protein